MGPCFGRFGIVHFATPRLSTPKPSSQTNLVMVFLLRKESIMMENGDLVGLVVICGHGFGCFWCFIFGPGVLCGVGDTGLENDGMGIPDLGKMIGLDKALDKVLSAIVAILEALQDGLGGVNGSIGRTEKAAING